jgi:hypothetical protein
MIIANSNVNLTFDSVVMLHLRFYLTCAKLTYGANSLYMCKINLLCQFTLLCKISLLCKNLMYPYTPVLTFRQYQFTLYPFFTPTLHPRFYFNRQGIYFWLHVNFNLYQCLFFIRLRINTFFTVHLIYLFNDLMWLPVMSMYTSTLSYNST